jgi:hypothetical protein
MKYLKETTNWNLPNHTYIIDGSGKMAGYIKENTSEKIIFNKPKMFYKKDRTFKELKNVC